MESYLVIKNKLNESCVCSGIRRSLGKWDKTGGSISIGGFRIVNHVAGNMTSIENLLDCQFSAIGCPAVIVMSVEFENNRYDLFCTEGSEDVCCLVNSCFEIGAKEKDIINNYNQYALKKLDMNASGFCYFLLLYFGFASENHAPLNRVPLCHTAQFHDLFGNCLAVDSVYVIHKSVIEKDVQTIETIDLAKSTAHRIRFDRSGLSTRFDKGYLCASSVTIVSPIKWTKSDIGRSDDGIYKRFYGTQSTSKIKFSLEGFLCLYKLKFFEQCESLGIPFKLISEGEYEFMGDLRLPTTEEEVKDEDWYEPDFNLSEW